MTVIIFSSVTVTVTGDCHMMSHNVLVIFPFLVTGDEKKTRKDHKKLPTVRTMRNGISFIENARKSRKIRDLAYNERRQGRIGKTAHGNILHEG